MTLKPSGAFFAARRSSLGGPGGVSGMISVIYVRPPWLWSSPIVPEKVGYATMPLSGVYTSRQARPLGGRPVVPMPIELP